MSKVNSLNFNQIHYQQAISSKSKPSMNFQDLLSSKISSNDFSVKFSKHAKQRLQERDINLSMQDINSISTALKLSEQKGIKNPLIVADNIAYIANVQSRTIITAVENIKGKVFTNVDGVVNI